MHKQTKFTVSHAPFWHDGDSIAESNLNIMVAALPAILFGIFQFGMAALGVICLAIASAMAWDALFQFISKRSINIGDYNSAVIGMITGMMLPATAPWWVVIVGTLVSVILGQQVFGGIGANPFNPAVIGIAVLSLSWGNYFDFDAAYLNYQFDFKALAPLGALRHQGPAAVDLFSNQGLLMGNQLGAIGSVFGLGLIIGGIYLIIRGYIRWEICVSYIAGIAITAALFQMSNPEAYAGPLFHLFTGYTLLAVFFLAPESSSSPVNCIPMIIYGLMGGIMTILIRNIGAYADGTLYAILIINLINPLIDKIRPKALGKGVNNA